jgi:hypothetical protein
LSETEALKLAFILIHLAPTATSSYKDMGECFEDMVFFQLHTICEMAEKTAIVNKIMET